MKKVTLSVAALAIAISSYGQCDIPADQEYQKSVATFKAFE